MTDTLKLYKKLIDAGVKVEWEEDDTERCQAIKYYLDEDSIHWFYNVLVPDFGWEQGPIIPPHIATCIVKEFAVEWLREKGRSVIFLPNGITQILVPVQDVLHESEQAILNMSDGSCGFDKTAVLLDAVTKIQEKEKEDE